MGTAGLSGQLNRRKGRTTISVPGLRTAQDLVQRDFNSTTACQLWCADITYIRTWEGWLYLASVMDAVAGGSRGGDRRSHAQGTGHRCTAMAVARRRPDVGVVRHSDHDSQQYTSLLFTQRCNLVGIEVSNGSRGLLR